MGPLIGHQGPFITHLGTEHVETKGVSATQHLADMQTHVPEKTKATLWGIYWKLISSPSSFHTRNSPNRKQQDEQGQGAVITNHEMQGRMHTY